MTKVNSILNYIKSYQESIERLRHNVPGFTFNGFTVTVGNETHSGGEVQVITVFGIVNTELDEGAMDAIVQTVPKLNQSISSITVTDYGQIIKEPNAPIYYNQTIKIVTTNEKVEQLEAYGKDGGHDSGNFLIADDIPEMPVVYSYNSTYYKYSVITPDNVEKPVDKKLEGNNETSGDEVVHDSGHDLTEQEAKEILDNMLGKNEEFNALTDVLDKLFKAGTFPEDQPKTLKELIDKFQDGDKMENVPEKELDWGEPVGNEVDSSQWKQQHENTPKDETKKPDWDKITITIPEEHLTLTDEDEFDITFDTDIDAMNTRITVINIKGINNIYFFNRGHMLTLTTQAGDLAGDITTGFIADVETDDDGLHVWVSEQLPTPSPVKDERWDNELQRYGLNSKSEDGDVNSDPNKKTPIEYYAKGEPGVEGNTTTIDLTKPISGSLAKIFDDMDEEPKADHLVLKGVKITLGNITLNADELVFDGKVNLVESSKED